LVLCRFADGRIVSLELVKALREAMPTVLSSCPPGLVPGAWGEAFAVGVKLRRVGPIMFASVPTVLSSRPPPVLDRGGAGRSVCSCGSS
jgi:hypothetical protein